MKANEIKDNALLLVESFDRISRMGGYDALEIIISIIQADCAIYTLFDNPLYSKRKKDSSADISLIQNILERANDESRAKSERSKDAKARNLKRAENGEIINKRGPFWLTYKNGRFEFNEHAKAVKRATSLIFDVGCLATATELNKEHHTKKYSVGIVSKVLRQKALYGSYVAYDLDNKGKRTIIKQEIKDYYPALISEAEFNLIGAKLEDRRTPALAGNWHKFHQNELRSNILGQAMVFNSFECPLDSREVDSIADSVYRFITRNFSIERLNELKSERAKESRQKSKANLIYVDGKPWEEEGIPKRTYYYRKKNGIDCERENVSKEKPWVKLGIGRTKWYELGKPDSI